MLDRLRQREWRWNIMERRGDEAGQLRPDLRNGNRGETANMIGDEAVVEVAKTQLAILVAAPGEQAAIQAQGSAVVLPTRYLSDTGGEEALDAGDAGLAVLVTMPCIDSDTDESAQQDSWNAKCSAATCGKQ